MTQLTEIGTEDTTPCSLPEHLGTFRTSVSLVCPKVLSQQGGVGKGAATQGTLVAAVGLPVDSCLVPLERLLPAEPSATRFTQDAALQGMGSVNTRNSHQQCCNQQKKHVVIIFT